MRILIASIIVFYAALAEAQQNLLPKAMAPWEFELQKEYQAGAAGIVTPPSSKVRSMAEWEEAQALLVTWTSYTSTLSGIVKAAQKEGQVIVVCNNIASVKQTLNANQVDTNLNITYLIAPFNSVWCRDYGANTVYKNDVDSMYLVDWIYNRPRYRDDTVATSLATLLNVPLYTTSVAPYDLVNTGGNYMSDGSGTAFASKLVLEENGPKNAFGKSKHNEAGVDSIMRLFMGVNRYIKFDILPNDGIHHIDMHMKLLNESTLMVGQYPKGLPDEPQIEANLQYLLSNYKTVFGTDYQVIRMPMPPYANGTYPGNGTNRTYTNATIFNKTVIIPSYELRYDTTAISIWKEAMPGYTIAPVNCNSAISAGGAVHCITKEIGVADPIRIVHNPYRGSLDYSASGFQISAKIQHISGIQEAWVSYRTDTTVAYTKKNLLVDKSENWQADLPAFAPGTKIYYYLEAVTNSNRSKRHPIVAPETIWQFEIKATVANQELTRMIPSLGTVYPNPAHAITCIPVTNCDGMSIHLQLVDALGRVVKTIYKGESEQSNYFINAGEVPAGIYTIVLRTPLGNQIQKLVIN